MPRIRCAVMSVGMALFIGGACSQGAPIDDSPEARLDRARALTAAEVASGVFDSIAETQQRGLFDRRRGSIDVQADRETKVSRV